MIAGQVRSIELEDRELDEFDNNGITLAGSPTFATG
jgi:hypothetical protein